MDDDSFSIQIPTDDEGYLALRCPHCELQFKIRGGDYQERDIADLYCANCGLSGEFAAFLPPDVMEAMHRAALDHMLPDLQKAVADLNRSAGGLLSIHAEIETPPPPRQLRAVTDLAEAELPCCETAVKLSFTNAAAVFYCPFCGQAQT
jgi:predicted RNA-binding Zn-ribbon protein involved in translation (DUF1610 family)